MAPRAFCPQAYSYRRGPLPLVTPTVGTQDSLTPKAPAAGELRPPAHLGVAGASPDGQQMAQLPSLSSLPGLRSPTKTGKEWGRWASGQASPRTLARGETSSKGSLQAPSPTKQSLSGLGPQKREGTWGRAETRREPVHGARRPSFRSTHFIASSTGWWMPEIPPWGLLDTTLRFC